MDLVFKGVEAVVFPPSLWVEEVYKEITNHRTIVKSMELQKGVWVHPAKLKPWDTGHRFFCVSSPYEDAEEWARQVKYWKNKHGVELKGPEKLVRVMILELVSKKERKVRVLAEEPLTYPVECITPNRRQMPYEIIAVESPRAKQQPSPAPTKRMAEARKF